MVFLILAKVHSGVDTGCSWLKYYLWLIALTVLFKRPVRVMQIIKKKKELMPKLAFSHLSMTLTFCSWFLLYALKASKQRTAWAIPRDRVGFLAMDPASVPQQLDKHRTRTRCMVSTAWCLAGHALEARVLYYPLLLDQFFLFCNYSEKLRYRQSGQGREGGNSP